MALAAIVTIVVLALAGVWPFDPAGAPDSLGSTWDRLLDPTILGFLRLGLLVVAVYGIVSVPVLIAGGRWATTLGTGGLVADEGRSRADAALAQARRRVAELEDENAYLLRRYQQVRTALEQRNHAE